MRNFWRVLAVLMATTGLGPQAMAGGRSAARTGNPNVNACGCYRDVSGACFCGKKGKCECPGECEPKGCDEKRAKEMDKEVEAEVKRAREAEKKQRDAEAARKKKAETVDDSEEAAAAARLQAAEAAAAANAADPDGGAGQGTVTVKAKAGNRGDKKG
ncbi:MAG: hypothetical protein ABI560_17105, partial [Myxococcales bacterium]